MARSAWSPSSVIDWLTVIAVALAVMSNVLSRLDRSSTQTHKKPQLNCPGNVIQTNVGAYRLLFISRDLV